MKVKKKYNFSIIFSLIFLFINTVNSQKNINYRWDKMLSKYVSENGNVNYNDWKKEQDQLKKYIKTLEENSPKNSWVVVKFGILTKTRFFILVQMPKISHEKTSLYKAIA